MIELTTLSLLRQINLSLQLLSWKEKKEDGIKSIVSQ